MDSLLVIVLATMLLVGLIALLLVWWRYNKQLRSNKIRHFLSDRFIAWQPRLLLLFLILFVLCVIISTLYYARRFLPIPVALPSRNTVSLFNLTTIATGVIFFITQILLFYFAFRYRTKPMRTAAHIREAPKLEIIWTVIPACCFLFLFWWGQHLWTEIVTPPEGDILEVEVTGEQYNWQIRYPGKDGKLGKSSFRLIDANNRMGIDLNDPNSGDDFVPVQMHVPKNHKIKLVLRSKDVIHSFYIPFFMIKMDAVPGMTTTTHFTATMSTAEMRQKRRDPEFNYEVACAELCGKMHFAMKLILVVDEADEFEVWSKKQRPLSMNNQGI